MFESPEQALAALRRVGYFTDQKTATTVYLAGKINKPILLEGPAGAGKTELAQSVARATGVDLLRLQCAGPTHPCGQAGGPAEHSLGNSRIGCARYREDKKSH